MLPENANGAVREKLLRESCTELARRLRAGEDCKAEDFLPTLPLDPSDVDAALELIYTEYVIREELGQQPSSITWCARFPHLRDRLERLFPIGELLDEESLMDAPTIADTPLPKPLDTPTGRMSAERWVDDYQLLARIGRGGMGVVYKARQKGLDRIVALKMISGGGDADAVELARFRREAENVARLQHPNIVQIYAVGEREGQPFFSMEFAEGGSLARRIAGATQPARQSAQWLETLARAMHYAHQQGLVHRDLKPANVVFSTDGIPKITDFGLAKRLERSVGLTWSMPGLGTPNYISPEQAACRNEEICARSDVYSLGAILYELLTGRPPFKGDSPLATLGQVLRDEPVAPRNLNRRVDPELEAICLKCLEKKPTQRYLSAEALADDLARWLRGEPTRARPQRWTKRIWRPMSRHPWMTAAAGLLLISAITVPVVAYVRSPVRDLERVEDTLNRGRMVELIASSGGPKWSRLRTDPVNAKVSLAPDNAFSLTAFRLGLLELLPHASLQRYRFSAEVRHDNQIDRAKAGVGIYVNYSQARAPQGQAAHHFCGWDFNALGTAVNPTVQLGTEHEVQFSLQQNIESNIPSKGDILVLQKTALVSMPYAWHRVALEVTPEGVKCFWEDRCIAEHSQEQLLKLVMNQTRNPVYPIDLNACLDCRGGLGLYAYNATASFRSVVIEPLTNEN